MFEIRKGVPIPPRTVKSGRKSIYPFADMAIGDSFEVPVPKGKTAQSTERTLRSACAAHAKRANGSVGFSVRRGADSLSVWMTVPRVKAPA